MPLPAGHAAEHQRARPASPTASRSRAWASASTATSSSSTDEEQPSRRRYWIYGADPGFHDEEGTDLAAVAAGRIAVTPVHFDLTDVGGHRRPRASTTWRACVAPAAREVE